MKLIDACLRHRVTLSLCLFLAALVLSAGYSGPLTGCGPLLGFFGCGPYSSSSSYSTNSGQLPLSFEPNLGQSDLRYQYLSHASGYSVFVSGTEVALDLTDAPGEGNLIRATFEGADPAARAENLDPLSGRTNYLIGNDPSKWITDVPTYRRIRYRRVYPGVDVVYYGSGPELEHDFVVAPGVNPNVIRLRFEGAEEMQLDASGGLVLSRGKRKVMWRKPVLYQEGRGQARRQIEGRYAMDANGRVGFEVGFYDISKPLVIDPVVTYSSYLGRGGGDTGSRIAVDANGNTYVTGGTTEVTYPVTPGVYQGPQLGAQLGNVIVTKLNATGDALVYSTHIGGSSSDVGLGIAVDPNGNVYVAGASDSADFPVTPGAFSTNPMEGPNPSANPGNCFVMKLNQSGSALAYSTFLGGNDRDGCLAIAIDGQGNAYVTGATKSLNFPVTTGVVQDRFRPGSVDPAYDLFLAKLNPDGSRLLASTYFGGSGNEAGMSLALDSQGAIYVAGFTTSPNFPVTQGAFRTTNAGFGGQTVVDLGDAFVLKLKPDFTAADYCTLLGGRNDDIALGITVDARGSAYIVGSTLSGTNGAPFPTTTNAYQTAYKGTGGEPSWSAGDAFVAKLNPTGTALEYSTLIGGSQDDRAVSIALDSAGNAWITGNTLSPDFPVTADAQQRTFGGTGNTEFFKTGDAFITELDPNGRSLVYSTFLGGSSNDWGIGVVMDRNGVLHISGGTSSSNFPVNGRALQGRFGGTTDNVLPLGDAFVARIGTVSGTSISDISNAGSYAGGGVAPGEIVVIKGVGIGPDQIRTAELTLQGNIATTVAETRFFFDNVPAPIVYVLGTQSSVVVPYSVAGKGSTQVVAEYKGQRSAGVTVPVVAVHPGLFSADASGRGRGAILNQDFSYNSLVAAEKGSIIQLFGTGEGQTNPDGVDGKLAAGPVYPVPRAPVTVTIGGIRATVHYAGAAPGLLAGLLQINAEIPNGVPSGDVPVVVTIGTASTQTGLTVSVK